MVPVHPHTTASDTRDVSSRTSAAAHPIVKYLPTSLDLRTLYEAMRENGCLVTPVDDMIAAHDPGTLLIPKKLWDHKAPNRVGSASMLAYMTIAEAGGQYRPTVLTLEQIAAAYDKSVSGTRKALARLAERGWLLTSDYSARAKVYRVLMWPLDGAHDPRLAEFAAAAAGFARTPRTRRDALRDAVATRRRAILEDLVAAHGPRCFYCHHVPDDVYELHIEHKQPVSRGGTNDRQNLVPACAGCNSTKGDMTEAEFYAFLETAIFEGAL